jgi:alpha-tubulin suppressor-like RCC1 family protein
LYSWGCNDEGALGRKCGENDQGIVVGDPKTPTLVELEVIKVMVYVIDTC